MPEGAKFTVRQYIKAICLRYPGGDKENEIYQMGIRLGMSVSTKYWLYGPQDTAYRMVRRYGCDALTK